MQDRALSTWDEYVDEMANVDKKNIQVITLCDEPENPHF